MANILEMYLCKYFKVGRGAKKEVKSATATTAEMTGKLSLRINNQGVATLHSIKVLQPKQVKFFYLLRQALLPIMVQSAI